MEESDGADEAARTAAGGDATEERADEEAAAETGEDGPEAGGSAPDAPAWTDETPPDGAAVTDGELDDEGDQSGSPADESPRTDGAEEDGDTRPSSGPRTADRGRESRGPDGAKDAGQSDEEAGTDDGAEPPHPADGADEEAETTPSSDGTVGHGREAPAAGSRTAGDGAATDGEAAERTGAAAGRAAEATRGDAEDDGDGESAEAEAADAAATDDGATDDGATDDGATEMDDGPTEGRVYGSDDVAKYDRFKKIESSEYDRVNDFLRKRTYVTAREWAIARLCTDFRTETGVEMTLIGENLPELVPFMTDTYSPQAVNQARSSFVDKVKKAGSTFLYGSMSGFFTTEELDDVMYEVTETARFLLEVEGAEVAAEHEMEVEDRISDAMREIQEGSAELRKEEKEHSCPHCGEEFTEAEEP